MTSSENGVRGIYSFFWELLFVPPFLLAVPSPFVSRTPPFLLAVPPPRLGNLSNQLGIALLAHTGLYSLCTLDT